MRPSYHTAAALTPRAAGDSIRAIRAVRWNYGGTMGGTQWRFREMSPSEINQGTVVGEFFGDEPINTRLVREAIQNSLDAGIDKALGNPTGTSGPVRVRFDLTGITNPLPAARAARYLAGLEPHLTATGDGPGATALSEDMPYIVVEDAGTTGLCGDWRAFDTNDSKNYFYWFFRNIGLSGKGESDSGSWGLGKWVFPDASLAKGYIAVTKRFDDGETLLMGQTVLNKHTVNGQRYDPVGYFATPDAEGMALPLRMSEPEHQELVSDCISDFGLQWRSEPGLSIIIPFPDVGRRSDADGEDDDNSAGIDRAWLLDAVIRNYFYPIIAGSLEVVIVVGNYADADDNSTIVNRDTIDRVVAELDLPDSGEWSLPSYRRLFAMCRASLEQGDAECHLLDAPPSRNHDQYDADLLGRWRSRYQAGELLAFRVKSDVERRDRQRQDTELRVYLQRDAALGEGQDYYVRGTLSIHGSMDFIKRHREACALLIVDERQPLAAMLRDSEPPAHTAWNVSAGRAANKWVAASRRIGEVRNTPGNLLTLLEAPTEAMQKDAFADIFFWDGGNPTAADRTRRIRDGRHTYNPKPPPIPKRPQEFDVTPSAGGFRVRLTAAGIADPPACAHLQVVYALSRGNSFGRYREDDFRLHGRGGALSFQMGGCRLRPDKAGNAVFLDIDDPDDFEFAVSGFDPTRDVRISIERVQPDAGAEEGE